MQFEIERVQYGVHLVAVLRIINDKPDGYIAENTLPLVRGDMCKCFIFLKIHMKKIIYFKILMVLQSISSFPNPGA